MKKLLLITIFLLLIFSLSGCGSSSPSSAGGGGGGSATIPIAPVALATAGNTQNIISWPAVTGAVSYKIYFTTNSAGSTSTQIKAGGAMINNAVSPYIHTALINGTAYSYVVTAINSAGESNPSNVVSVTPLTPPNIPTNLTATTASSSQINLSWTGIVGATYYKVYRTNTTGVTIGVPTFIASTVVNNYANSGLNPSTTYYYKVTAVNAIGESAGSVEVSATTSMAIPVAPTGVTVVTASSTQININWITSINATSYNIYCSTAPNVAIIPANMIGTATAGPFGSTGLIPNTTYYYRVTAVNAGGESVGSVEVSAMTNMSVPAAPTGLTAVPASSTQININWTNTAGILYYNIYRATAPGVVPIPANLAASTTITPFNNTGLTPNTAYYYKVTAVNTSGESPPSAEAMAATPPFPPTIVIPTVQ